MKIFKTDTRYYSCAYFNGNTQRIFEVAKELSIKIVFTTHDYFGLCPKVNLMDARGHICEDFDSGRSCLSCNTNALSAPMMHIMQSYPYRYVKDSSIVKSLRKLKRTNLKRV